jgi:hypothetical protein
VENSEKTVASALPCNLISVVIVCIIACFLNNFFFHWGAFNQVLLDVGLVVFQPHELAALAMSGFLPMHLA